MPRYEVALLADVLEVASLVSDGPSSEDDSALSFFVKDSDALEILQGPRDTLGPIQGSKDNRNSRRHFSEELKNTQQNLRTPRKEFESFLSHPESLQTLNKTSQTLSSPQNNSPNRTQNYNNSRDQFSHQKHQKTFSGTLSFPENSLDLYEPPQSTFQTNLIEQKNLKLVKDTLPFQQNTILTNLSNQKAFDVQENIQLLNLHFEDNHKKPQERHSFTKGSLLSYSETPLTNFCDSKNLSTHQDNPTSHLDCPVISPEHVERALMGNGQCCFRRYPGYQAHRHVVVSRGVQCNEIILRKNSEYITPRTSEKGDITNFLLHENIKNNDSTPLLKQKADFKSTLKIDFVKNKPEICTLTTEEPPELRESSKFYQKKYPVDLVKCRKYFDDDIDSLSATISNYSLHERLLKFDNFKYCNNNEKNSDKKEKNTQQTFNLFCRTPTPRQRQISFKGSTDAIRGSTTKTLTCHSNDNKMANKNEYLENQSCDSFTSFGHYKDNKTAVISNSGDNTESTPVETEKMKDNVQINVNNETNYAFPTKTEETYKLFLSRTAQNIKPKILPHFINLCESHQEEKPIKSNSDSKCSSSVTFMKGSEEIQNEEKAKSLEINNLNALRRKQKFLMRHSRNNVKFSTLNNNSDCPPVITSPEFPSHFSAIKGDSTPIVLRPETSNDYQEIPLDTCNQKNFNKNIHFNHSNNESSRNNCASKNSNHSERITTTPMVKLKRTVSFDSNKNHKSFNYQKNSKVENSNQSCTRNTVRAKYCSNKIIRQRFYIPESANIELILRDPSDRRIKAICDRHNCDIEVYSKVPKSGFLKNIIVLAAPNSENLRKCVRSLDYSMCWCLTAQLS